jgi:UDP-N-acetylglucosamine acyltransferase
MMVDGNPLAVRGFNVEGLRRRGFGPERLAAVKQMHRLLYRDGLNFEVARQAITALGAERPEAAADIAVMSEFLAQVTRGIAR